MLSSRLLSVKGPSCEGMSRPCSRTRFEEVVCAEALEQLRAKPVRCQPEVLLQLVWFAFLLSPLWSSEYCAACVWLGNGGS